VSLQRNKQAGFSLVELLVVIALVGVIFASFATFFMNYLGLYSRYQKDASNFTELASQSQRVSQVLRGVTDLVTVDANELVGYAYFAPIDIYTSQVRYYLSADKKQLLVDVTPMTSNPPYGTLLTAQKKTYTIITNYYAAPSTSLFTYYDAAGVAMPLPISDQHSIMGIGVTLVAEASHSTKGQSLNVTVSLRNRKTNL
jgi:prepilin-type N-terminal cleavage/methylation domain-containing protein